MVHQIIKCTKGKVSEDQTTRKNRQKNIEAAIRIGKKHVDGNKSEIFISLPWHFSVRAQTFSAHLDSSSVSARFPDRNRKAPSSSREPRVF